ncbi:MAG: U32 family peptidase [Bacilli bacterium]
MKIMVVANDVEHVKMLLDLKVDAIIVSSKYSSYRRAMDFDSIKESLTLDPNIYVSIYDLISESDLDETLNYISKLLKLGVKNYVVNDFGILEFLMKSDANIIYDNITFNTNYESINCLESMKIKSFILSREITVEEINEICDNTNSEIIVHIQGMFPIFSSVRKLLENYCNAKTIPNHFKTAKLYQKDRRSKYPIIETPNGVIMFSSYEQCGIEDINALNLNTFLIDQPFVNNDINVKIIKMYLDYSNYKIKDVMNISKYNQSKGFFYKKTMYKL